MPSLNDRKTTLHDLRQLMRDFVAQRQWTQYHTPKNLTAAAAVEAAELLELFQWLTPEEAIDRSFHDAEFRQAVGEEIADVMLYLLSLANALEFDVSAIIEKKMAKNHAKYPAKEFRGEYRRPVKGHPAPSAQAVAAAARQMSRGKKTRSRAKKKGNDAKFAPGPAH